MWDDCYRNEDIIHHSALMCRAVRWGLHISPSSPAIIVRKEVNELMFFFTSVHFLRVNLSKL